MTTIRTYDAADHAALVDHFARAGDGSPTGKLRCPTRTSCVRAVAHALHRTINSVNGYVPPIEAVSATC